MRHVAPEPGPHGGDGAKLAAALGIPVDAVLDLSASLNPHAPDVVAAVVEHADAVRRYPDPTAATVSLASAMEVDPERLVLTNGGSEAIALVAGECPVGRVDDPEFSLYAQHLSHVDATAPRWRSNPHNPTGRLAHPDDRADVWDEAFYPLAAGCWTRRDEGAIVIGSLTKVFACPGLRAGYVLAPDADMARRIVRRQPRWALNALACAVLPELVRNVQLEEWAAAIANDRAALVDVLQTAGLVPDPSDAPFVLVREASGLRDHLARDAVLVRATESFGIPDGIRIAVPDCAGLARVRSALNGWSA